MVPIHKWTSTVALLITLLVYHNFMKMSSIFEKKLEKYKKWFQSG